VTARKPEGATTGLEPRIVAAARRMAETRAEMLRLKSARNACKCDKQEAWFNEPLSSEDPPDACWKSWVAEIQAMDSEDRYSPYRDAESLDLRDMDWCEPCKRRWVLHPKVTAANVAHGNAKGALTRLLLRDAALRGEE
jgi:hypothetical protein